MTIRTPENAERVLDLLDEGANLRQVASELGCTEMALRKWVRDDDALSSRYARGRNLYLDSMADDLMSLADAASTFEEVNRARLQIETRKWYLCKLAPKRYGDKIDLNHGGQENGKPVEVIHRVHVDLG